MGFGVWTLCKYVGGFLGLSVLALLCVIDGCTPLYYIAEPIEGRVIDADSGAPIEGAVVVALWIFRIKGLGMGDGRRLLKVKETVTRDDGSYSFEGWGPRLRVPMTQLSSAPNLRFYSRGYRTVGVGNEKERVAIRQTSDVSGLDIRLSKSTVAREIGAAVDGAVGTAEAYDIDLNDLPHLRAELLALLSANTASAGETPLRSEELRKRIERTSGRGAVGWRW